MNSFLTELGKRLAEKWLSFLVLPGLLYLTVAACALTLSHRDPFDLGLLVREAEHAAGPLADRPFALALTVASLLLAATGVALVAQLAAGVIAQAWAGPWPWWLRPLTEYLTHWRQGRAALSSPSILERYQPARPTRIADRLRLIDERIDVEYGLRASLVWPRLWLLMSAERRTPIEVSRTQFQQATVLAGWAMLYLALGTVWWPVALAGVVALLTAVRPARAATASFAVLVESAVDIHQKLLAEACGVHLGEGYITRMDGAVIMHRLNKGA